MKIKKIMLVLVLVSCVAFSQAVNVPKQIKDAFTKLYPNATEVKWNKEGNKEFEASFKENNMKASVVFDLKGNVKETEKEINKSELPKGVEEYINKEYKGWTITETAKIVDEKGNVVYEAEISKNKEKKDLKFSSDGKLLKKEKNKSEKEKYEKNEDKKEKD